MMSIPSGRALSFRQASGFLLVAVASVLVWYAWLGWDTEYQVNAVTNETSGPYETWQVIGCVLSLLVLLVGAVLVGLAPLTASAALTLAFTSAWTAQAASTDDTGLFAVGTVMILFGLGASSTVTSLATARLRRRFAR
ncbi:hypothetical protein IW245_002617 [Longispora fulva]|uniref:Uncharacterized protein n=2 Tax=Longispora fulva TaxID=619741 RepID=A0A8J7GQU0_9ACTN|nr:hypothetical protein [Longispora fulva]